MWKPSESELRGCRLGVFVSDRVAEDFDGRAGDLVFEGGAEDFVFDGGTGDLVLEGRTASLLDSLVVITHSLPDRFLHCNELSTRRIMCGKRENS